jgi:hypothetical protein
MLSEGLGFPLPSLKLGFPPPFSSGRIELIKAHAVIIRNNIREWSTIFSIQGDKIKG